jgi:hypothetical protein
MIAVATLTMTANAALNGSNPRRVRPSGSPTGISMNSLGPGVSRAMSATPASPAQISMQAA